MHIDHDTSEHHMSGPLRVSLLHNMGVDWSAPFNQHTSQTLYHLVTLQMK